MPFSIILERSLFSCLAGVWWLFVCFYVCFLLMFSLLLFSKYHLSDVTSNGIPDIRTHYAFHLKSLKSFESLKGEQFNGVAVTLTGHCITLQETSKGRCSKWILKKMFEDAFRPGVTNHGTWGKGSFAENCQLLMLFIQIQYWYTWAIDTHAIVIHMNYKYTCNTDTHELQIHMQYWYTWTTDTHAILIHTNYRYTCNTDTHELQIHMQYWYTWTIDTHAILIHMNYRYTCNTDTHEL